MLIDFDEPIRDVRNEPVKESMTIGTCAVSALQHLYQDEAVTPEVKVRRFKLALRIAGATEPLALGNDDVAMIKTVVGKYWNSMCVYRVFEAVDPEGLKAI